MKILLLSWLALPMSLLAEGGLPNQPYIYVEGRGEIEKPADMATLRFDLVGRNADHAKANREVQAKSGKTLTLLSERNIAQNDVIATDLKSEPQYENGEEASRGRGKLVGYRVTRSFAIKIRDITSFGRLVDELIALGSAEFSSIEAGLSNEKEMRDDVWDKALANARERADRTLKTIGMKIDSVFAVSPTDFSTIRQNIFGSALSMESSATEPVKPAPSQYRLAPVTVSQSVHVIYLMSPAK